MKYVPSAVQIGFRHGQKVGKVWKMNRFKAQHCRCRESCSTWICGVQKPCLNGGAMRGDQHFICSIPIQVCLCLQSCNCCLVVQYRLLYNSDAASKVSPHNRRTKDIVWYLISFSICSTMQLVVVAAKTHTRPDGMTLALRVVR